MTLTDQELNAAALETYSNAGRTIRPMWPWVFVRVLPKWQKVGSIWTPEKQNKTDHEAIVLATWEPVEAIPMPRKGEDGGDWRGSRCTTYKASPRASSLTPGEHVMFPHWAGVPVPGFEADHYRMVKEEGWQKDGDGGIYAVVSLCNDISADTPGELTPAQAALSELLYSLEGVAEGVEDVVAEIEKKFVLYPRDGVSVTLSGR